MSSPIKKVLLAIALLVAAASAQAAGRVEVRWVKPELFSDIGHIRWQRDSTLQALGDFMQQLGQRLPDGQTLQIEVTDVDLAGELDRSSWHETRVLRGGADLPRISLRYTLQADGRSVKTGEASLADLNYLGPPLLPPSRQVELAYEKQMLERWFRETFAAP